jgi:hypothetical protein
VTMFGSQWFANPASGFDTTLIGNSVWLDGTADYLSKTPGSTGNQKRFLFAFWVQRNDFGEAAPALYSAGTGDQNDDFNIYWNNSGGGSTAADSLKINFVSGGSQEWVITTTQLFRDIAWYHIIISVDTAESTAADRVKIYVNGDQVTSFVSPSYPSEDADIDYVNDSANEQRIGRNQGANYLDAYMAQYTFLDGQSIQNSDVTVASFLGTQTFGDNGSQKIPVQDSSVAALATSAAGNSYCLDFGDSSALGNDISGEENDWTANSMAAANQSTSTPSLSFASWNNLQPVSEAQGLAVLTEGNLVATNTDADYGQAMATMGFKGGKWYHEFYIKTAGYPSWNIGWTRSYRLEGYAGGDEAGVSFLSTLGYFTGANLYITSFGSEDTNQVSPAYSGWTSAGTAPTTGDVIMCAMDDDAGKMWWGMNGEWGDVGSGTGNPATGANASVTWTAATYADEYKTPFANTYQGAMTLNSGQNGTFTGALTAGGNTDTNGVGDFKYSVPSGYSALASGNLTAPSYQGIDYFNPVLYAGNGTAIGSGGKAVTGTGFQPDLVWVKNRDQTDSHGLYDAVRGTTKQIESDNTSAETTESEGLTAFGADGFTVGSLAQLNTNTENYVAWQWLGANGTSTNEVGTLTSTVSVAEADHFSIVSYTGSGANTTVGHGLGAAPEMMICRELPGGDDWNVYNEYNTASPAGVTLRLDTNGATTTDSTLWNSTVPSSTIVNLGTSAETNQDSTAMILYCFRSVAGVCKVGSFTGNGSADGPYIELGFEPAFFIAKSKAVESWIMLDDTRPGYNPTGNYLFANLTNAEGGAGGEYIDMLSSGVKIRTTGASINGDGVSFIYLAMAEIGGGGTLPPIFGR